MSAYQHRTVMLEEVAEVIAPRSGGIYVDVTAGGGGHAEMLLERSAPEGRVIATDRDAEAVEVSRQRLASFGARASVRKAKMSEIPEVMRSEEVAVLDGLVADLGVSSVHLDEGRRGFSFQQEGPIDMRMDQGSGESALELIARLREDELADVIYQYGEERRSRRVARSIKQSVDQNELRTTRDLQQAVYRALGPKRGRIDPATRTFQALRIAVNDELGELKTLLALLPKVLAEGGVAAVISFHSLEDRLVKHTFRDDRRLEPFSRKPMVASSEECERNARARSAKLRAARLVKEAA